MLKIEFVRSRSRLFDEIMRIAKSLPGFKEKDSIYEVTFSESDIFNAWEQFSRFHNQVTRWSGCNVYLNGHLIKPYKTILFYSLQSIVLCARSQERHKCRLPNGLPGWGCSFLRRISRHLDEYVSSYWYDYGHFSPDLSEWIINKPALITALAMQASDQYLHLCPHFDKNTISRIIESLPDSLPIDGQNWQIRYRKDFVGDRIMNIPAGVQHLQEHEADILKDPFLLTEKPIDEMTDEEINRLIDRKRKDKTQ